MDFIKDNIKTIKNHLPDGTQESIAEALNITPVTVSRVWNGHDHAHSEETKQTVLIETANRFLSVAGEVNKLAIGVRKDLRKSATFSS